MTYRWLIRDINKHMLEMATARVDEEHELFVGAPREPNHHRPVLLAAT